MSAQKHSGERSKALTGVRVLLVEDESLIAMLLEDSLVDLGCEEVMVAPRLEQALALAETAAVDLAILDVNLNGTPSFPVAEVLTTRGVSFVFATGYASGSVPAAFQAVPMLHKPFRSHDLERALEAALGFRSGSRLAVVPPVAGVKPT